MNELTTGTYLPRDYARSAGTTAQDKGEFTDLCQTSWNDPANVPGPGREDHW